MADLVPAEDIERIVGAPRSRLVHIARAVSTEKTVYLLHSQSCLDSGIDLRECAWSQALDRGIDLTLWRDREDVPVVVRIGAHDGRLIPGQVQTGTSAPYGKHA